jgi:hypothetical protein
MGGGWSPSRTGNFTTGKETRYTNGTTGWVGFGAGLDGCGKSRPSPTGIRSPDLPARNIKKLSVLHNEFYFTDFNKIRNKL